MGHEGRPEARFWSFVRNEAEFEERMFLLGVDDRRTDIPGMFPKTQKSIRVFNNSGFLQTKNLLWIYLMTGY